MRARNAFSIGTLLLAPVCLFASSKDKDVPSWVTETASRSTSSFSGRVPAVVLLEERQTSVNSAGSMNTISRHAVKILNQQGKREAESAEFYMKGGRQVKALRAWLVAPNGFVKTLDKNSMADIGSFSAMELYNDIRFKVVKADAPQIGDVFVSESEVAEKSLFIQDVFAFQSALPATQARYILTLPPGWIATSSIFNHEPVQPLVNGSTYTWELKDLPYREREDYSPGVRGTVPRLVVNFQPSGPTSGIAFNSWKDVSKWHTELAAGQAEVTPALSAKVSELTAGAKTEYQRILAVSRYVQKIRYVSIDMDSAHGGGYKPHTADAVLLNQYGDCKDKANLMRAMLKAAGIQSYLVAIFAGDRTFVREQWPSPTQFNHMILAVRVSDSTEAPTIIKSTVGRLLIFDPTDDTTPIGDLPWYEQNSFALLAAGEQGDLLRMPSTSPEANSVEENIDAAVSETGALNASIVTTSQGQPASVQRSLQSKETPEQYRSLMQRSLNRKAKDAVIGKLEASDEFERDKFSVNIEFNSHSYAQVMQQRLLVFTPSVVVPQAPHFALDTVRTEPIILRAGIYRKKIHIKLPSGFTVDEMPPAFKEEAPFGKFTVVYKQEHEQLTMEEELRTEGETMDASQYPKVKRFFDRVFGVDNQKVVLVKN